MQQRANSKAMAILRVSSLRQKDNTSHDTQEKEIRSYFKALNYEVVHVAKIIESAKESEDRKKYSQAINKAIDDDIHHIGFYMFDRETRNLTDSEKNERLVRAGLISLHYVRDNKVLHQGSSDSDFFMRDMQTAMNKHFVRNLSGKVRAAQVQKAEEGWIPTNKLPLGYAHIRLKDSQGNELKRGTVIGIDPNSKRVEQVLREFQLKADGHSYSSIRKRVIEEGFIPADKISSYHVSAIERRIKSEVYRGYFTYQGKKYRGKHPLIIPNELLALVDETGGKTGKKYASRGVFGNGWLKCTCGCNIVADPKKKTLSSGQTKVFYYYHCTNGKRAHETLRGMHVTEESLFMQFGDAIDTITITPGFAKAIADGLSRAHEAVRSAKKREIEDYRLGLDSLENQEDAIYQDLKKGILDESGYCRQIQKVRDERKRLTLLLENANENIDGAYLETAKSILELARDAKSLWLSRTRLERKEFLEQLLSNQVLDKVTVRYDLKIHYKVLAKMWENKEWRPELDEFRTAVLYLVA